MTVDLVWICPLNVNFPSFTIKPSSLLSNTGKMILLNLLAHHIILIYHKGEPTCISFHPNSGVVQPILSCINFHSARRPTLVGPTISQLPTLDKAFNTPSLARSTIVLKSFSFE